VARSADPSLERLLGYVRDNRGFDFTGYKRASLTRRVLKRMHEVGLEGFPEYQDYLEVHPDEFTALFNTILINVTSFFRDPVAWDALKGEVVPRIVEKDEPIRIWCVGCASGEEAYTLAMVFADAVGLANLPGRVKIYATDVDDDELVQARAGVYATRAVEAIPAEKRELYLDPATDGQFGIKKELRRTVIFGRHDLVKDAPISRVDLIACRNTLMYFNADVQSKIYGAFYFALAPRGYLFLGKSEMLLTRTEMFMPVDLKRRVFERVPRAGERNPPVLPPTTERRLRSEVFESATIAQVVLDAAGIVIAVNQRARSEFALGDAHIGHPFHDLELSFRPLELRSRVDRAATERRVVAEAAVPWMTSSHERRYLDVEVVPLFADGEQLGTSVTFTDVSRAFELKSELERSRRELETAYEEIQSTVEELETTNEELQSTNEELETTNEELQSTNEELETMNEELHSTNEELNTINTELIERTGQLNQANVYLGSVLASVRAAVIVLNRELAVQTWNHLAEDMWGLRADEVQGKNLLALDIGLPVDKLRKPILDCLADASRPDVTLDATNRRGRLFRCQVAISPMRGEDSATLGAILLMEEEPEA
jgi:two-component system CheB/CheR fusion protein